MGEKIKQARKGKKLTQEKLAQKLGVSRLSVIAWESGKYLPKGQTLLKLVNLLNLAI